MGEGSVKQAGAHHAPNDSHVDTDVIGRDVSVVVLGHRLVANNEVLVCAWEVWSAIRCERRVQPNLVANSVVVLRKVGENMGADVTVRDVIRECVQLEDEAAVRVVVNKHFLVVGHVTQVAEDTRAPGYGESRAGRRW